MRKSKLAYTIVRIVLGLAFLFYGVVKFYPIGSPPSIPQPALDFMTSMVATGYFLQFIGIAEILVGLFLLANFWVPFAMMILSALMLNIILFNIFLSPSLFGFVMLLVLLVLQAYIMYYTWNSYKSLFAKVK